MLKLIKTFLGIEASAKNIRGNKSSGNEDLTAYKHWRKGPYGDLAHVN